MNFTFLNRFNTRPGLSADARQVNADGRRAGDEARDARQWAEAAARYAEYLEHNETDASIRIQLGNCLKEDGRLVEALQAYDAALVLDERNADGFLQKGHVLKLLGRKDDAAHAYRRSVDLAPRDNPAFSELLALGQASSTVAVQTIVTTTPVILIDVTDLIDYLRANVSLSGIQRVISNLILHACVEGANAIAARPVLPDYAGGKVYELSPSLLIGMVDAVLAGNGERALLDRALEAVVASRKLVTPNAADTLLVAGAFWIFPRYDLLNALRLRGVIIAVFVHDLLQITNEELVPPGATDDFRRSFVDVACVSNYLLTNSTFVADEVRRFLSTRMNFELPVTAVTLATELGSTRSSGPIESEYSLLAEEDYVLCVGTLEIRKNHMYLIRLWEKLATHHKGLLPNLVLVGKWGWEIDELRDYLEGSDYLGGRLYIFNAIPDRDLAFLYENCLFTIYPSFAEGWGLPVGESLAYGKPCLASKATSIPEVGGAFCRYFDPLDLEDGYALLSDVLNDRPALAAWAARIRSQFRPKTWSQFSAELLNVVVGKESDRSDLCGTNNCVIETGQIATFGDDALKQLDAKNDRLLTARMSRVSGWHALETWGCWAAKRKATLMLHTRLPSGTAVDVYMQLKAPDRDHDASCTVTIGQIQTVLNHLGTVPVWFVAGGETGKNGRLDITLTSGKGFFHTHGRELFVGILGIAVVPDGDAHAEDRLMRQIVRRND